MSPRAPRANLSKPLPALKKERKDGRTNSERSSQSTRDSPAFPKPPDLNYSLKPKIKWIVLFWSLVVLDCVITPIALYFGLWYGTNLSHNAVFSISTGAIGSASIFEYFLRFYRLWKASSTCRVIGANRLWFDWLHWNLSVAWIIVMIELIVGTIPREPPIRLLAMPAASMLYLFAISILVVEIGSDFGLRTPIRISSLSRGSVFRPGIYSIIEDVIAVDGSAGTEFRQRLNMRYQASHLFRRMLHRLSWFWGLGGMLAAGATTAIVFTVQRDAAYALGWTLPFLWAGLWAAITIYWVKKDLRKEYANWGEVRWQV